MTAKEKKKPGPKPQPEMVTVECICNNVHLGNGVKIKASRNSKNGNWKDGERAEVSVGLAELLVKNEQCKIV